MPEPSPTETRAEAAMGWPPHGGAQGRRIRALDWAATPVGPIEAWPAALRHAVELVLDSPVPMSVLWGPAVVQIYNDSYENLVSGRGDALGRPMAEVWPDIWEANQPIYRAVRRGEARWFRNQRLVLARPAGEEIWCDLAFSPVRGDDGAVGGILVSVLDTTAVVRAVAAERAVEERLRTVLDSTTDCVLVIDRDWTIQFENRRARDLLRGGPLAQGGTEGGAEGGVVDGASVVGRNLWEAFPDIAGTRFADEYRRAMREQVPVELVEFSGPLGRWFEVHAYPSPDQLTLFFRDVTRRRQGERRLAESEARLRTVLDQMPVGVMLAASGTGEMLYHNARAAELLRHDMPLTPDFASYGQYGGRHGQGQPYRPEDYPLMRTARTGRAIRGEPMMYQRGDGSLAYLEVSAAPIQDSEGRPVMVVSTFQDVTERKAVEQRQLLLMREVDHRAKNALAVVQALVRLTRAADVGEFIDAVDGRVEALARAHALLADRQWRGAGIRTLVRLELDPYLAEGGERLRMAGADLDVAADTAQPLGMVLHELATNAAKYGALSVPGGQVAVSWGRTPDGGLWLEWRESGGPAVRPPRHRGFGSELIEASALQLGGPVRFDWQPDGLTCTLMLDAECLAAGAATTTLKRGPTRAAARTSLEGRRVLIVEDDLVLGLAVKRELEDAGCIVLGPAANLDRALALAGGEPLDAAVLDVNLRGRSALPVAELLAKRGVPHLFTTGYDGRDLGDIRQPILEKPFAPHRLMGELRSMLAGADKP